MAVHDPNQAYQTWGDAFNRGDIDALVALYAADAVLVPERASRSAARTAYARLSKASSLSTERLRWRRVALS